MMKDKKRHWLGASTATHILMTGDFNYPRINWDSWTTAGENTENEAFRFIEAVRDAYSALIKDHKVRQIINDLYLLFLRIMNLA